MRILRHVTYANVASTIALASVLGGTAWAATQIGTAQLRNGSVTSAKLRANSVTSAKVANGSLRLADINARERAALKGTAGADGAPGKDGAPGAAGAQGPAGPQGAPGSGTEVTGLIMDGAASIQVPDVKAAITNFGDMPAGTWMVTVKLTAALGGALDTETVDCSLRQTSDNDTLDRTIVTVAPLSRSLMTFHAAITSDGTNSINLECGDDGAIADVTSPRMHATKVASVVQDALV